MNNFVEVIPLGGLGEFGMNSTALRCGSDMIVIDAGMGFPSHDSGTGLGVHVIVPDITFLKENEDQLRGIILTHGHEDHVGAVSFFLQDLDVEIYGSRLTLGLVSERLKERQLLNRARLNEIAARQVLNLGCFEIEALHVTHSYPDSFCLAIRTPAGTLIWSGDFKFDQTPIDGKMSDLHRLASYGESGVLALFSDSTNSAVPGLAPSESNVREPLRNIFRQAPGRIVATTFASSIHRIQIIFDLAREFERVVVPVGRSIVNNIRIANELGYLNPPPEILATVKQARDLPPSEVVILASGSQGEPMSALTRLAIDQFKNLTVEEGDTVILSTRIIPGNEKSISRMVNHFFRRGARVVDTSHSQVHVSGHGYRDDLKLMINLTKPSFFIPIHGEYRQLKSHTWIARDQGLPQERIVLMETGDVLRLDPEAAEVVDKVTVGRRFIDDGILEEVHEMVLRERRFLSEDGFVIVILRIDRRTGVLLGEPEIVSRGFIFIDDSEGLLAEASLRIQEIVEETSLEEKQDDELFNEIIRKELKRFFRKQTGKRPLILSLTLEI
ncbi:MAG: ribonuclease J [Acidobacteriota bacterium]|nr:MAG: ribonuclease J [Acidobacteriota bacterium]